LRCNLGSDGKGQPRTVPETSLWVRKGPFPARRKNSVNLVGGGGGVPCTRVKSGRGLGRTGHERGGGVPCQNTEESANFYHRRVLWGKGKKSANARCKDHPGRGGGQTVGRDYIETTAKKGNRARQMAPGSKTFTAPCPRKGEIHEEGEDARGELSPQVHRRQAKKAYYGHLGDCRNLSDVRTFHPTYSVGMGAVGRCSLGKTKREKCGVVPCTRGTFREK